MCDVRGVQLPAQPSNGHEADDWHQDQVHPVVDCAQAQEEKKGGTRGEKRKVEARQWAKVTARQQASDGVAIGGGPQIEQSAGKQQ